MSTVLIVNVGENRSAKAVSRLSDVTRPVTAAEVRVAFAAAGLEVAAMEYFVAVDGTSVESTHVVTVNAPEGGGFSTALLRISRALDQDCVAWMWWPHGYRGTTQAGLTGDRAGDWLPFNPQYFYLPQEVGTLGEV